MEHFIYYPSTMYHVFLSFLYREYKKTYRHSIILDEHIFSRDFIDKISVNGKWEHVYILQNNSRVINYVYRNILYRLKYADLFHMKQSSLVFFTFGNNLNNLLINSIHRSNNILMGEDGVFPYYGFDIIEEYNRLFIYEPWINKFKRRVKNIMHPNIQFNLERIDKLLIMNPEWLPIEVSQQYQIERVTLDRKSIQNALNELTVIYEYKSKGSFNDIDIIFFDSDYSTRGMTPEQAEYDFLYNIFDQLRGKRIFVKLRPHGSDVINHKRTGMYHMLEKRTSCSLIIDHDESKYPWEIVYYNNIDALKDVIFMGESFSTAFVIPKKIFGRENDVIYLRKLFAPAEPVSVVESKLDNLIERINKTFSFKKIYTPASLDEIRAVLSA